MRPVAFRLGVVTTTLVSLGASPAMSAPATTRGAASWTAHAGIEYSTFLGIHRAVLRLDAQESVFPFGLRLAALRRHGRLSLGASTTLFTNEGFASTTELLGGYELEGPTWRVWAGGAVGIIYTSDDTLIPTYTEHRWGPSLQTSSRFSWWPARRLGVDAGASFWIYPTLSTITVPVGIDVRWSVGIVVPF